MSQRISYYDVAPDGMKIMMDMEKYTKKSTINRITRELIKIRVSQINGCAFCMDMHTSDARKIGETEQRIYCLNAWNECDFYTPEEKVALELSEHITLIPTKKVPEDLYKRGVAPTKRGYLNSNVTITIKSMVVTLFACIQSSFKFV